MVTTDKISDVPTCDNGGSIVTAGPIVWKDCILHSVSTIFLKVVYGWLSNLDMVTMDRISDISNFSDLGSIFKITVGLNVWKYCILHFVAVIFLKIFHGLLLNLDIIIMMTMDRSSDISNFGTRGSIFKVTAGLNVWKYCSLHFVSIIFPE